ncbi:DNA methyltransferase [Paraburkholderia sp. EG287A]|uniref:DNA methyltransferase n=1 Tax=Paraburkholderia sp. EG287A TaxID=3237012 RepID=UPI0034D26EFA
MQATQLNLFSAVLHAYGDSANGQLSNAEVYAKVANTLELTEEESQVRVTISGESRNALAQRVRWYQQTLKKAGILEHVEGERAVWGLTQKASKDLSKVEPNVAVVGFSTELGVAILGTCEHVFSHIDAPITLVLTSPPYPLRQTRAYGNPPEHLYVDWVCQTLEPLVKNLVPGGSICLNISNDIFLPQSPARSLYVERLIIALHDRLGLFLMDRLPWVNRSKPPGPIQYASIQRNQLNVAWEPLYWLTNDPKRVRADNRRVLQQHSQRHLDLSHSGGEKRDVSNSDGAYVIRPGAYGAETAGSIPKNVLFYGHRCAAQLAYKKAARALGLPVHGAPMPLKLAMFLIEFLSEPGDIIADPFSGSFTTADAAEQLGRQWIATECMLQYVLGGGTRFVDRPGYRQHLRLAA